MRPQLRLRMTVLFMSNWQKTYLFAPVAKILESNGFKCVWVCTSPFYRKFLLDQGFSEDSICWLRRDEARTAQVDYKLVEELEAKTGDRFKSWAIIDREVGHWKWNEIRKYGAYIARKVLDHMDKHDVKVVFGEPDTYHELISSTLCDATGRIYMGPFSLRLPISRFVCWIGPYEKRFAEPHPMKLDDVPQEFLTMATEVMDNIKVKKARPFYWYRNNNAPKVNASYIGKAARGLHRALFGSKVDSNMYSLRTVIKYNRFHMRPFYYMSSKVRWSSIFDKRLPGERFVLFTLQKQPEYTIDVLAWKFSNQYETIRGMARSLPADVTLYVKEHRNSLGDRSVKELMELKALPGVRLIDPMEDIHELIQHSEMVVSPASTASLEAAIYGKPSYTLADTFMNGFSTCFRLDGPWDLGSKLNQEVHQDLEHDTKYLGWVLANSFEGVITNRDDQENAENVANGMAEILTKCIQDQPKKAVTV